MKDLADFLLDKYGPRLTTDDLAEVLKTSAQNIRKDICREKFPIPTFKVKNGRRAPRYADYRDVAAHINASSGRASQGQGGYTAQASASPSSR